jgi:hypothetical protein
MNENSQPKITIEVSTSGLIIRVENISSSDTDEFDNAYTTARRLLGRIPHLNQIIEFELMVEQGKLATAHLWTQVDDGFRLAEIPTQTHERIALSLFRVFPQCKKEADIVKEIKVLQKTANYHLRGEIKSSREFFSACDEGYTLTETGINWALNEVIPNLNTDE